MTRRRRGNVFMNPAGWAYAAPQGSLDGAGAAPASGGPDPTTYGTIFTNYDPALEVTEAGLGISAWGDRSVEANDLAQATDADRPSLNSTDADFNNVPSVTWDGTEFIGRTTFTGGAETQPTLWVMAYKLATTTGVLTLIDGPTSRNLIRQTGGTMEIFAGTAVQSLWATNTSVHIGMWLVNGASTLSWIDGTPSTPAATPGAAGMNGINIGANSGGDVAERFNGKMAMITGFTGEPSTANKNGYANALAAYIGTTWTDIV